MSDETRPLQEAVESYEPPAVVLLGSFEELTLAPLVGSLTPPH
jgi:hypothetical protein